MSFMPPKAAQDPMIRRVREEHGSMMVCVPRSLLAQIGARPGSYVAIAATSEKTIVIAPAGKLPPKTHKPGRSSRTSDLEKK